VHFTFHSEESQFLSILWARRRDSLLNRRKLESDGGFEVTGTVAVNAQDRQAFDSAVNSRPYGCPRD
jgi:hypothetical protein